MWESADLRLWVSGSRREARAKWVPRGGEGRAEWVPRGGEGAPGAASSSGVSSARVSTSSTASASIVRWRFCGHHTATH